MKQSGQAAARQQNLRLIFSLALALLLHGAFVFAELQFRPPRPRKPIAVAMLDAPNKKPPTPEILPPSHTPKARPDEALPSPAPDKAQKTKPRKLAKKGQSQAHKNKKNKLNHTDAGVSDSSTAQAGDAGVAADAGRADAQKQAPAKQADDKQAVAQAGGRRNCAADGPGATYTIKTRPHKLGKNYFSPGMLLPFRTRPALDSYLGQAELLGRIGPRALGTYRIALPEQVIRWNLDEPRGASIYVGRNDARCAIVVRVQKNPLKMRLRGLPVRLVDAAQRVSASIVDIDIDDSARLRITRRSGARLPFTRARLANSGAVAASIKLHMMW